MSEEQVISTIVETLLKIVDSVIDKQSVLNKHFDKLKLKTAFTTYIQTKFNDEFLSADLEQEFDYEGLSNYLLGTAMADIIHCITCLDASDCRKHKESIVNRAKFYASASSKSKLVVVEKYVNALIYLTREFYIQKLDIEIKVLFTEMMSSLGNSFFEIKEQINRKHDDIVRILDQTKREVIKKARDSIYCAEELEEKDFEIINRETKMKMETGLFLSKDLTLSDLFILPKYKSFSRARDYDTKDNSDSFDQEARNELGQNQSQSLLSLIENFSSIKTEKTSVILITGLPGAGKTSFLSYVAYHHTKNSLKDAVYIRLMSFVRKFSKELNSDTTVNIPSLLARYISDQIGKEIKAESLENKLILLDGLDEICDILEIDNTDFFNALVNSTIEYDVIKYKFVITCRSGYVSVDRKNVLNITLFAFDRDKIIEYFENYSVKNKKIAWYDREIFIKNMVFLQNEPQYEEIFGVPLILYICLSFQVLLINVRSVGGLYDYILKELERRNYDSRVSDAEQGHPIHRIISPAEARKCAQNIAFQMFLDGTNSHLLNDDSSIFVSPKNKRRDKEIIEKLIPITFYYKVSYETDVEGDQKELIEFAHNSMKEFFVAEKLVTDILDAIDTDNLLQTIYNNLGRKRISKEIYEFVLYKISLVKKRNFLDGLRALKASLDDMGLHIYKSSFLILFDMFVITFNILNAICSTENRDLPPTENCWLFDWLRAVIVSYEGDIPLNLHNLNLDEINLSGLDLKKTVIKNASIRNAQLKNVDLYGTLLYNVDFSGSCLDGAQLSGMNLDTCNFKGTSFKGANLSFSSMRDQKLDDVDFRGANMKATDFSNASLNFSDMRYANLQQARFCYTNLTSVRFGGADMRGTAMQKVDITVNQSIVFSHQGTLLNEARIIESIYSHRKKKDN